MKRSLKRKPPKLIKIGVNEYYVSLDGGEEDTRIQPTDLPREYVEQLKRDYGNSLTSAPRQPKARRKLVSKPASAKKR